MIPAVRVAWAPRQSSPQRTRVILEKSRVYQCATLVGSILISGARNTFGQFTTFLRG